MLLLLCVLLWGTTTFLQRLSADHMSPIVIQTVVALGFVIFVPIAFHMEGGFSNIRWSPLSIGLSLTATALSICGNVVFYSVLKGSNHTGSMAMFLCLYPIWTLVLSVIFLHEAFTVSKIIGIVAMIIGTIFLSLG